MSRTKWYIHPVFVFVLSTVALIISLFLYIYWYLEVSEQLKSVVSRYGLDKGQFFEAQTWVVILILSVLVGLILVGTIVIFIYNLKLQQLYHLQHTFINNFTHELKTPVTSLKLYLETFARHELEPQARAKYLAYMLQDVERLSAHINSILNLARIESRIYKGEKVVVNLQEMMNNFISVNHHLFRGAQIKVHAPDKPLAYPVILPLFEMLLTNIFINAIKYNDSTQPQIDVCFAQSDTSLFIKFRDNGVGLSGGEVKKIFRKFYRGRQEGSSFAGGSGIGLYLVQQIAKIHKGKVTAESEGIGKGSTFTLILPKIASQDNKHAEKRAETHIDH